MLKVYYKEFPYTITKITKRLYYYICFIILPLFVFSYVYVCVCVRKLNLLLAHCTPVTHSSCKLILYSCKFHFSVTMQAIWATGKGLLTTWSWPPPHLSVTTAPPQGAPEPCIQGAERGKVHWRLPAEIHSWIFIFRSTSHEAECQIQINGMCLFNLF